MSRIFPSYREEVRLKILDIAWEVFISKGFRESTMDDIAHSLGCSKGSLYNYFDNKEELLQKAILSYVTNMNLELTNRFVKGDFVKNMEDYFTHEVSKTLLRRLSVLRIFLDTWEDKEIRSAFAAKFRGFDETLAEIIETQKKTGKIRADLDSRSAAERIHQLLLGIELSIAFGMEKEKARVAWSDGVRAAIA